jgi:zinc transporter ZupT
MRSDSPEKQRNRVGLSIAFIAFLAMLLGALVAFLSHESPGGPGYTLSFALMIMSFVGMMIGIVVHYFEMGRGVVRFVARFRRREKSEGGK